ncbi:MAG: glycoside hydrolase family 28 protein [Sedimentisphaerales bacterium]|nr:glycoside hydrolase family 28 protein [Sedimentisphaerales bacterium]
MKRRFCLCALTGLLLCTQVQARVFDVREFGAVGDGTSLDTDAINRAIEAAAEAGGGTVYFPAGTYASFSIRLKSNIALHLDQGATLLAAEPNGTEGYDRAEPNKWGDLRYQDFGHSHWHDSLIWGENLENVSILGPGLIHGKGLVKWDRDQPGVGNKAVALKLCRNVVIRDVTFLRGGHFCILPTGVDNFTIDNVKIDTNRDGINIDCCRNVRISNCTINTPNDDAIVLKSSYALGYARATENVTITNCQVTGYDEGTFLDGTFGRTQERAPDRGGVTGRIKFGTESNGGFKNITISNCVFERCRGLALETVDGGLLEDVTISNITMREIVNAPFFLRLGRRMRGPEGVPVGKLRRVNINNVVISGANPRYASLIMGIPGHDVEDITLSNIRILVQGGATREQAQVEVPELETDYPDPRMFGQIPAYGFFIRHAQGIELNNVEVAFENEDLRPAFVLDDVKDVEFNNVEAEKAADVPTFVLKNVEDFHTSRCEPVGDAEIEKAESEEL